MDQSRTHLCRHILMMMIFFIPGCTLYAGINRQDTLNIPYIDSPPAIDGNADDWQGIQPFFISDTTLPDSLRNIAKVFLSWDEENLYSCVVVHDTRLCTDKDINDTVNIHLNDAIELWIDSHNDSKTMLDENDYHFILDVLNRAILFRGDKTLIEMGEKSGTVPQRSGNTPMLYKYVVKYQGTINTAGDIDSGYVAELSIPWSAMGTEARTGVLLKMECCLNDQDMPYAQKPPTLSDSLGEAYYLSYFHFIDWSGIKDFGYPNTWKTVRLSGSPGVIATLSKHYSRYWLTAFLITIAGSFLTIGYMAYKIFRLKHLPVRSQVVVHPAVAIPVAEQKPDQISYQQKIILNAREYIEQNLSQTLTTESVAAQLAMSPRQLQRIVKEELQTTPTNLIHIVRLEKAAAMLANKEGNVTDVAFAVGFNDSSHFSKLFKRYYSVPPSLYSKEPLVPPEAQGK